MKSFSVSTTSRAQMVNVTSEVAAAVRQLKIVDGVVTVFVPHTTAGVTINENADPDVVNDVLGALEKAVPWNAHYAHSEGNAAAHVKTAMVGTSAHVLVEGGQLQLGTWQGIFLCEFDGPRQRKVWVK